VTIQSVGSPAAWAGFIGLVLALLAVDLGFFHRKEHVIGLREATLWSAVWISLAALFNLVVFYGYGPERALEFTTGYLLEKALAVDNLFVFVVVFSTFAIPAVHQHRVLFWGVLGALVMRAGFIVAGGAFVQRFHVAIYVFGALLGISGIKLLFHRHAEVRPEQNPVVRAFRRIFPVTNDHAGARFIVRRDGRRFATPLLLALVTMEVADLVFAVDSIPAIFAITRDPFIVFTSNIFAILGLRSLYFLLAGVITRFAYLKLGLAFVLIFAGLKMLLADLYQLPVVASLAIIAGILAISIAASLVRPPLGASCPPR
jgi:tellurite resistance protein TerC